MAALIATAGTLAGAASSALPVIGVALSAASAYSQIRAGRAQAAGLAQQAALEQVKARGEALRYKEQANRVYQNILQNVATVNARAAAGAIDPFSGSPLALSRYALAQGTRELQIAKDNELIAREGGVINSALMQDSGQAAYRSGIYNAVGTLGQSAFAYNMTRIPKQNGQTS